VIGVWSGHGSRAMQMESMTLRSQMIPPERRLIHPRSGPLRRATHPGEVVVGVMTAHPAWLQFHWEKDRADSVLRAAELDVMVDWEGKVELTWQLTS